MLFVLRFYGNVIEWTWCARGAPGPIAPFRALAVARPPRPDAIRSDSTFNRFILLSLQSQR